MNKRTLLIVIVILGALALYFLGTNNSLKKGNHEPIVITSNTSSVEYTLDELIAKSDLIVIGEFVAFHPAKWNTPSGELPDNATIETVSKQHLTIFSDGVFQISQLVKGDTNKSTIQIRTFGGEVGQDKMVIAGEPSYVTDQTYLLFLFHNTGSTANNDPESYYGVSEPYQISDGKITSDKDEWVLKDLISYIQNSLSQIQ